MTKSNFQRTSEWLAACGKTPGPVDLSCQIGVHLEEVVELLREIEVSDEAYQRWLYDAAATLEAVGDQLKRGHIHAGIKNRIEALDALCDCEVTGNGIAYLAGFLKDGADDEVLASNESKLVDGKAVILEGGKIGKGRNYFKPELEPFV